MKVNTVINELLEYGPEEDIIVLIWDKSAFSSYIADLVQDGDIARDVADKYHDYLWAQVVETVEGDGSFGSDDDTIINEIMAEVMIGYKCREFDADIEQESE